MSFPTSHSEVQRPWRSFARRLRPTWPFVGLLSFLLAVPVSFATGISPRTLGPQPAFPTEERPSPTQLPEEEHSHSYVATVQQRATIHDSSLLRTASTRLAGHLASPAAARRCVLSSRSERLHQNGCGGPLRC
jgi:hypothetical protein